MHVGLSCSCSSTMLARHSRDMTISPLTSSSPPSTRPNPAVAASLTSKATSPSSPPRALRLPFTKHQSGKVCLKSALIISQSFGSLPYPNPQPFHQSQETTARAPRTMPAFACCAMQSSYALLMLHHQTRALNHGHPSAGEGNSTSMAARLLDQLACGIRLVLRALENYSMTFEALDGMRGE